MRVLVTGSRTWTDPRPVREVLSLLLVLTEVHPHHENLVIVHGACPEGVDHIVDQWAHEQSHTGLVLAERHPANWHHHGKAAGPRRNQEMVDAGADLCLAFIQDNSRGATHCADAAQRAGIPTQVLRWYTPSQLAEQE